MFAQPFLINRVIDFVGESPARYDQEVAHGLIAATFFVYAGISVCPRLSATESKFPTDHILGNEMLLQAPDLPTHYHDPGCASRSNIPEDAES